MRDIDREMKRTKYARTWELVKELRAGRREPDGLHPPRRHLPARLGLPVHRAPAGDARRRRAAGLLHQRLAPRLLPALRGRDGADAADGRHPGPRGHRLHPRRLLVAPQGLDRPRHRRPRLGRGLVREVRLGRRRSDALRHARPLPGRRAGRRRVERPGRRRTATPARTAPPTAKPNPISVRPDLQLGRDDDQTGTVTGPSHWGWLRWLGGIVARARGGAGRGPVRPPPARQDPDGPRDLRGRGRDAPRRPPVVDRHDADPARTPPRLALPGGRGVPALAGLGPLRARARAAAALGPQALRRALAQGLGFGGGLRALWALPPRYERGERPPRTRTLEVETSVRVRG